MANSTIETLVSKSLQLVLNNGASDSGSVKTKTKSFVNINPDATAEQLKATADALATLLNKSTMKIYNIEKNILQTETAED